MTPAKSTGTVTQPSTQPAAPRLRVTTGQSVFTCRPHVSPLVTMPKENTLATSETQLSTTADFHSPRVIRQNVTISKNNTTSATTFIKSNTFYHVLIAILIFILFLLSTLAIWQRLNIRKKTCMFVLPRDIESIDSYMEPLSIMTNRNDEHDIIYERVS